jgi:hypothetical protein
MNFFNGPTRSDILLVSISTVIILFAIAITTILEGPTETTSSQIITVGPVWDTNTWICTSSAPFLVHATLIGYENTNILEIFVSGSGTQPDFQLERLKMETFSVGDIAGGSIRITTLTGQVTGFLTLQTQQGATASCEQV